MTDPSAQRKAYLAALCRNVPYHIVERVLADPSPAAIDMQDFDGSVLQVDLVGFTGLCEELARTGGDALSRLAEVLSDFFERLLEDAFFPFEGFVVQFGGDSTTVVFREKDHARRAGAAALRAQQIMREAPLGRKSDSLHLRTAIASGSVRLHVMGVQSHRIVVCGGDASRAAMEIQRKADPGIVVLDDNTAELLGEKDLVTSDLLKLEGVGFELRSLRNPPERKPIVELGDRIDDLIEEKIELLEPFVPGPISARLRAMPDGWRIEGELRNVVVVYAEVIGWTLDNIELGKQAAQEYLAIHRKFGGLVTRTDLTLSGHRSLSFFGLHAPTENDSERAVMAALEAVTYLKNLVEERAPGVTGRIGIHTGPVFFGAIGSRYRYDISVVGDVVHTAARVAGETGRFQVTVTDDVLAELRSEFSTSELGSLLVRGASEQVATHTVHGVTGGRARYVQHRSERRRFAGRKREVRALADAVKNGLSGRGELLTIVGGAGVGKSCLLASVIDDWTAAGGHGLIGRCRYTTRTQPLAPIKSMLLSFVGLTVEDSAEEKRRVCKLGLEAYDLEEGVEELTEFLASEYSDDDGQPVVSFGDEGWERILSCLEAFVHKRLEEQSILYILEDIHHADTLTLRFAMRLSAVDRSKRFLLIATTRPEPHVQPLRDRVDREILIENLGLRHSATLVAMQFGARDVEDSVAAFLWERTKGNPGQLVELVRFLRDRGLMTTRSDVVIVPSPGLRVLEEVVPKTMAQFALARLDSLGEIERRVLRISSTIGRTFVLDVLESVAGSELPTRSVALGISRLLDEGVIKPEIALRPAYRFRDDVTRAATYSSIPKSERRDFHRRIADVLERHSGPEVDRRAVILARHRERAEQLEEAARWYERAILLSASATLDEETRFLVDRWESVVDRLPEHQRPSKKQRASMAVRKFIAVARHLGAGEALELGRHIASNFWNDMDTHERALVDLWHGVSLFSAREMTKAQARLARAYETSKDPTVRCEAALYLVKCFNGDRPQEEAWLNRATAQLASRENRWAEKTELTRACLLAADGDLDEARVINARVRDSARRRNRLRIAAVAASNLADCDLMSGDVEEALEGFLEAQIMARALGTRTDDSVHELNLGISQLFCGRPADARPHLEAALKISREIRHKVIEIEAMVHLGAAIGLTEDLETGESLLKKGREAAVKIGASFVDNAAGVHLLHLAIRRGDAERVGRYLEECERIESELVPLLANSIDALRSRAREVVARS